MPNVAFEAWVAKFYFNKVQKTMERGIEFNLSLMSVHNILRAKRCYYTGIELTRPPYNSNGYVSENYRSRTTDVTLERLDNTIGYVAGNVVACSKYANSMKGVFEDPSNGYELKHFIKMAKVIEKQIKED